MPDTQLDRFKGYKEINSAFDFAEEFYTKYDKELGEVIKGIQEKKGKTKEEQEREMEVQKEVEREQRILDKLQSKSVMDQVLEEPQDVRSSVSVQEKLRQSMISEVEIDLKQTAIKKVLDKQDFDTYKRIDRGEMDSELGNIVFSDKDINKPIERPKNLLESSFDPLDSDDESVYNVYWEEFEKREIKRRERDIEMLRDPMMLLEKLQSYSKNLYRNLSTEDKNDLMRQIEKFLDEGVSPLQKYYDELKGQFNVPSRNLINFEKKEFHKQLAMIRKAQKKELDQIRDKHMAQLRTKRVAEELVETANATVKKEMTNIVKQFNQMSKDLYARQKEILKKDEMLKNQEKTINELRLMLFQSVSRQALNREQVEEIDKWLSTNLEK